MDDASEKGRQVGKLLVTYPLAKPLKKPMMGGLLTYFKLNWTLTIK